MLDNKKNALFDDELELVTGGVNLSEPTGAGNDLPPADGLYVKCGTPGCKYENWTRVMGCGSVCGFCNKPIQIYCYGKLS